MFDYIQFKDYLDTDFKSRSWIKFTITHANNEFEYLSYKEVCERATIQAKEEAFKAQLDAVLKS